ncbi:MAG: 4-hydroxybenzoate octaprenyltransferase [Verrucomicrobiales bacterium]|nr:4-hydroxybenzoate octaprenyltransferase [Verrucomicrobiales bacterium]
MRLNFAARLRTVPPVGTDTIPPRKPSQIWALVRNWGGFVKFSHTLFALPFAFAAMALASRAKFSELPEAEREAFAALERGWPGWRTFLLILAAMVTARTCAMAFNRIADRDYDAANPRTRERHLPAGKISLTSAWTLTLLSAAAFLVACWFLPRICFYLAPVALFFIFFYSLTKRFNDFTHIFLGIALAIAPVGAWLAVTGEIQFIASDSGSFMGKIRHGLFTPLTMSVLVLAWVVGFDLIYSIQDYEFDRENKLHSLVVRWGPDNAIQAALLCHMLMYGILVFFGLLSGFKLEYWIGLVVIMGCLGLEHWIVRRRLRKGEFRLAEQQFFRLNALISMIFLVVVLAEVALIDFWSFRGM